MRAEDQIDQVLKEIREKAIKLLRSGNTSNILIRIKRSKIAGVEFNVREDVEQGMEFWRNDRLSMDD